MEEVQGVYRHFFTLGHRCVFKIKDSGIVLKVFTIFNELVFKASFSKELESDLKSCIPCEYSPTQPTLASCKQEVEDLKKEIEEDREGPWSVVRSGEESISDPRVFIILNLNLALQHIKLKNVDQAIEVVKKIAYDDPKIGGLFVKLHVLKNRQEECLLFISQLIEQKPSWASDLYRHVLRWIPTHWIFYTELASLVRDPAEKAHIFVTAAFVAIESGHYKSVQTFLTEARKIRQHFFPDILVQLEIMEKEGRGAEIEPKLQELVDVYEKLKDFKSLCKVCKKLISLKYCPLICQKIIVCYLHLEQDEKVLKWWQILVEKEKSLIEKPLTELAEMLVEKASLNLKTPYELWAFLGKALLKNTQFRLASDVFRKGFQTQESRELAEALAKKFEDAGDKRECVWFYGEAFRLSLKDISKANHYLKKIESLNPSRVYLSVLQEKLVLLHKQAVSLRVELEEPHKTPSPRAIEALLSTHELIFIPGGLSLAKLPNITIFGEVHDSSVERGYWMVITSSFIKCTTGICKEGKKKILQEAGKQARLTYQHPTLLELLWWLLTQNYRHLASGNFSLVAESGELITSDGSGHLSVTMFPLLIGTMAVHRFTF